MPALPALPLRRGQVNLEKALIDDDNILAQLRYPEQKKQFWDSLAARKDDIEEMVRYELGVDWCHLYVMEIWRSGSFNVVIRSCFPTGKPSSSDFRSLTGSAR